MCVPLPINLTGKARQTNSGVVNSACYSYAPGSNCLSGIQSGTGSKFLTQDAYDGSTNALIGSDTVAGWTYKWLAVPAGIYQITAVATDNLGGVTTSAPFTVTVASPNAPPTVSLTSPAANAVSVAPGSFILTASAASTAGTIARVDFYQGATLIGTATATPYSYTWSDVPLGAYSLTAKATDASGTAATSAAVIVTVKDGIAQVYYIHTDHLDTPRQITDTGGNAVWMWDNVDPFGNNMADENPGGLGSFEFPLRFPGQYFDRETNLHYNYFRDYDPGTGRYIQFDPIGLAGGINGYTYVGGNPLNYTDPSGLVRMYSCWGGANWSGCSSGSDIPTNPAPPKNAYDACDMQHDYCYAAAQGSQNPNSCSASPAPTIADCDRQLAHCTLAVPSGTGGLLGSIWGTLSGTWAILKGAGAFGK